MLSDRIINNLHSTRIFLSLLSNDSLFFILWGSYLDNYLCNYALASYIIIFIEYHSYLGSDRLVDNYTAHRGASISCLKVGRD